MCLGKLSSVGDFLSVELLADCSLIKLHGIVARDYETIFNSKYFIINAKITALCNRGRSVVLTYIYIKAHTHK